MDAAAILDEHISSAGGATAVVDDRAPLRLHALRGSAFVRSFVAPDPVIEAIPATGRGRLIAVTGLTGHGKTTVAAAMQVHLATGTSFAGRDAQQGRVLVLCGENPDDYNLHLIATMVDMSLEPADLDDILVVPSRFQIDHEFDHLEELLQDFGDVVAVFVDTSAAFYFGDDDNSNTDQYAHASRLRMLTTLPGRPVVFVLCHPTKGAHRENLVPRGGGAFLNEVDANLTVWKDEAGLVSLHWGGKMRGPNFEPLRFELKLIELQDHPDHKGRPTVSVVARFVPEERAEQLQAKELDDEDRLLVAMQKKPGASVAELGMACGWSSAAGKPSKSRVDRRLRALEAHGLVSQDRKGCWLLTAKGQKEADKLP